MKDDVVAGNSPDDATNQQYTRKKDLQPSTGEPSFRSQRRPKVKEKSNESVCEKKTRAGGLLSPNRRESLHLGRTLALQDLAPAQHAAAAKPQLALLVAPAIFRPDLVELDAGIARRDHETAFFPGATPTVPSSAISTHATRVAFVSAPSTAGVGPARVRHAVESALLAPPGDPDDGGARRPGEDRDAVRVFGLREAKRCGDFLALVGPHQRRDLGVAVDGGEVGAGGGVEEVDASVIAAAACGEEGGLPGCECNGFDSGVERERVLLLSGHDVDDCALSGDGARGLVGTSTAHVDSFVAALLPARRRAQNFLRVEKEELVVVAARGEVLPVRAPSDTTDLLRVAADASKQRHAAMPVEQIPLIVGWPLDRVVVDIAGFVSYEELFRGHRQSRVTDGRRFTGVGRNDTQETGAGCSLSNRGS